MLFNNLKRYEEAIKWYKKALELKPDSALFHENIGLAYEKLGKKEEAKDAYQTASENDQRSSKNLAKVYLDQGNYEKAIELLEQAIQAEPDKAINYDQLGLATEK